ncbi:MAG: helix-turn-helix domain-containing protein, partial [Micromonosporaceae bacterium]|nr:helix-turn-helix domain-containing protein [Micromonosporaceae bacterium]
MAESAEAQGVRSVQRALDILSLLTDERPSVTIREIVEATGLAKTTVIRLVQTLEQSGLLWATTAGYMAGPGLWRWAHLARRSWELPPETQRMMRDLAARQRETVNVYVARDIYRVCIAQQESPQALRHVVHVGDELPLWGGASAKVLLRNASPGLLVRIARSSPYGDGHVRQLQEWIDEAAQRGYAVS